MSFERQEKENTCGPTSLRYALSLLGFGQRNGEDLAERDVVSVFGPNAGRYFRGFDEDEIARAARRFGLRVRPHARKSTDVDWMLEELKKATAKGHPCIATWHDDDANHFHWVCVAGFSQDGERAIVLDPYFLDDDEHARRFRPVDAEGEAVIAWMSVKRLREWFEPVCDFDPGDDHHFFLEVWPEERTPGRYLPGMIDPDTMAWMESDREMAVHFDEYLDDLRDIFGTPSGRADAPSAAVFLDEHRGRILSTCDRWTFEKFVPKAYFRDELEALRELCRAYRLEVARPEADVFRDLGFYLGWRACEQTWKVGRYEEEED